MQTQTNAQLCSKCQTPTEPADMRYYRWCPKCKKYVNV